MGDEQPRPDDADASVELDPAEQDAREATTPQEPPPEPAERITRATPQRKQRAPMIRQPEDLL